MVVDVKDAASEARVFGARLRSKREELRLSVVLMAERLGSARTYLNDCEAGRKFPKRSLVEALAALTDDDDLLSEYDELRSRRMLRVRHPQTLLAADIAVEIGRGVGSVPTPEVKPRGPLPRRLTAVRGPLAVATVLDLLTLAGRQSPGLLILHMPALSELDIHGETVDALRRLLFQGWDVVDLVRAQAKPDEQIRFVRRLLSNVGYSGRYQPITIDTAPVAPGFPLVGGQFIVAEGVGALTLLSDNSLSIDSAICFTWDSKDTRSACELLLQHGRALAHSGRELITIYGAGRHSSGAANSQVPSLPEKIQYDSALTEAETKPGRRALIKCGLIVATMPPAVAEIQTARWKKEAGQDQAAYIELLRLNRKRRWESLRSNDTFLSRDICTKTAIRSYLADESDPNREHWAYQSDPLYSGRYLELPERISHVRGLIELVSSTSNSYEIGLADDISSFPFPLGESYWEVTEDAILFLTYRGEGMEKTSIYGSIRDATTVEMFFDLHSLVWDSLPAANRDRASVVAWLLEQVRKAEDALVGTR